MCVLSSTINRFSQCALYLALFSVAVKNCGMLLNELQLKFTSLSSYMKSDAMSGSISVNK